MPEAKKITVYFKLPCPYCVAAKRFLEERALPFEEIDLTHRLDELEALKKKTGWRTVPMIFFGDELIGGYTDLKALEEAGELEKKLRP